MNKPSPEPPSPLSLRRSPAGSALLVVLMILAVTLLAVGSALFEASHRFRASHQSERWAEAGQAAEAGAEIALTTAQKGSWTTDTWSNAPGSPGPATKSVALDTGVPATNVNISVDQISMSGSQWLRIRSVGIADAFGGSVAGIDSRDVILRKLSLRKNRSTGATVSAPKATRTIEVLAQPVAQSKYTRALLIDQKMNMTGSSMIDSFDSSDPTKSTGSLYDVAKRQSHGDVGINDTQGLSDLLSSYLYGNLSYSGPAVANTGNVQGTITTPFNKPVAPNLAPTWATFNATPTSITSTSTLTGGAQGTPARYKVSNLTITGSNKVTLAPHAAGAESYVEIWITGVFKTTASANVQVNPGVHATFYIGGNIDISGSALNNQNPFAANFILNLITPAAGVTQTVDITGSGTNIAVIDAPAANITMTGSGDFSGAVIGKTFKTTATRLIHYDEALAKFAGGGAATYYRVASWVEAVR